MSMNAQGFGGGGGGTVVDASETTAGKIRIATSAEAATGTSDLIAMTPLTVKEVVDASKVGVFEYKGTFNATAGTPSIANAEQGDIYVIDTAGTIYGQDWNIGDHLLINADMGGSVTNSKIDKVDNTDSDASETVKGIIEIATNAEAGAGTATDKALVPSNVSSLSITSGQVAGLATVATTGAYSDLSGTPSLGTAAALDVGTGASNVVQLDGSARLPAVDGSQLTNLPSASDASETVKGIIEIATNAEAGAGTATDKALVPSNVSSLSIGSGQVSGLATVATSGAYSDLSGTPTLGTAAALDVGTAASNVVQLDGSARLPAVDGSQLTNLPSGNQIVDVEIKAASSFTAASNYVYLCSYTSGTQTITFPSASSSNDGDLIALSSNNGSRSVSIVSSDGTTNDITDINNTAKGGTNGGLSLDIDRQLVWFSPSGTSWRQLNGDLATVATTGAYSDLSGTPTLATVATTGAYSDLSGTPTLATVATTGAYSDLSGTPTLGTAAALDVGTGASNVVQLDGSSRLPAVDGSQLTNLPSGATDLNGLSDVTITSAASGNLLQYNGSGQFVNVAKSTINVGSFNDDGTYLNDVVDDTTPQLGGPLDTNGQSITSASNADVTIDPNGTGDIVVGADVLPAADALHALGAEDKRFATLHSELNGAVQFKARNETGGALTKGQAVYISGVSGTVPLISLARANSASTMPAFGLLAADVSNNADVQVITFGNLTDYNTTTYSLSANDTVYVSAATAGALTSTAPTGESNLIQNIGRVVRADASAGIIKVGGAGRSNATPNLDDGKIFLGNASNQAVSTALSAINVGSFNDDGTYLNDVVDDTTPQLGGDLDVNGNEIVSASNNNVILRPNGTGVVQLGGNTNPAELRLYCESGDAHYVGLKSPAHASLSGSQTWTLPVSDGTSGQVIQTNGSGELSFLTLPTGAVPTVTSASPSSTYTITTSSGLEEIYLLTPSVDVDVVLPAASSAGSGYRYNIKNLSTNVITVKGATGDNIDGEPPTSGVSIGTQYESFTLVTDGSDWFIV